MGKINVLQPGVFNMISAGEVVERPASVVKELVENSIDAGATEISVTIEEGGIRRITVSDDGTGVLKEDMRAAFLPHATSKLSEITDLDTISTLGFRGEALASIASVSEVTMVSRADGSAEANKLSLSAGKVTEECVSSRAKGTSVTVENLFFNTPARLKFLKKPSVEQGYIVDAAEKIVLSNPALRFSLSNEKGVLIEHAGGDLASAMSAVYPNLDMGRFIAVEREASSGIRVRGYISEVDYTAPTRSRQTVIVNGRSVTVDTVSAAVDKAYRDYLVKRTYPMYVLDIVVPFEEVDVNVHPAKTEVRFRNKNAVFGAVFRAVEDALKSSFAEREHGFAPAAGTDETEGYGVHHAFSRAKTASYEQTAIDTASLYDEVGSVSPYGTVSADAGVAAQGAETPLDISSLRMAGSVRAGFARSASDSSVLPYRGTYGYGSREDAFINAMSQDTDEDLANSLNNKFRLFDGTVVGQVFDTYLIVERANVVYIIDQHAAHERILYDKLTAELKPEYAQTLLIPHKLRLSGEEREYFEKIMPALNAMGFVIEQKPNSFIVYALPEPVVRMDFEHFLSELFSHMLDDGELKLSDLMKETVCRDACRAAIKGGEHLTKRQIEQVLANFLNDKGELPQKCPHGRPAVVALTRRDFEKMFLRIV